MLNASSISDVKWRRNVLVRGNVISRQRRIRKKVQFHTAFFHRALEIEAKRFEIFFRVSINA